MPSDLESQGPKRKKVRHFDELGDAHFLTFSCFHRLPLFSKDRTRRWLLESLEDARRKHGFHLWAWVIMPEHVHLLIWPPGIHYRIESILADVKRPVGQKLAPRPEDWPWSSARDWAGYEDVLLRVDRTLPSITEIER